MFVQVIKGTTNDPAALRSRSDRWRDEVRPGATGFLGSTGGVTDDGTFILFARFDRRRGSAIELRPAGAERLVERDRRALRRDTDVP